ncbi:FCD domain-containing protein [Alginatibacterium sediminis]|uniref:FCD domain-containing protein n=1 Tax=Alginatibacterium sediminis TaxID=2164068 RepID=UPI001314AFF3|nr:FCD domain-containing protein [Alginatibacterium sediminis]
MGNIKVFYECDHAFHHTIAKAAKHPGATTFVNQTRLQLTRVRSLVVVEQGHMESVIKEHLQILKALDSGTIDQALKAMQFHLDTVYATIERLKNAHADFFVDKK